MKKEPRYFPAIVCFVACVFLLTGCETLRKKFTRKRKKAESTEAIVIVPRDYSAHPFPNDVLYRQYFIYWKSWNQELVSSLTDMENYKKIKSCADQALVNLKKMQTYLREDKAQELELYVKKTSDLLLRIEQAKFLPPAQTRALRYDADRILSSVNKKFDFSSMKDHLK